MAFANELELLGFDVFGTVVDWRSGVGRAVAPFLARYGIDLDPLVFADRWRARYQPSMQPIRTGERPWVRLPVLNRESLVALLAELGAEDVPDAELDDLNRAWERLDPWPDAVEGLTRLKRRYPIATISNGDIGGMMRLARFGGLPWDAILGAEVARSYKPTRETYLRSAEAAGVAPGALGMVAAHSADLAAARSFGLRTIFVHRPDEKGPDTGDRAEPGEWDIVARDLNEVANLLGC